MVAETHVDLVNPAEAGAVPVVQANMAGVMPQLERAIWPSGTALVPAISASGDVTCRALGTGCSITTGGLPVMRSN